jgi:adenylate cyclase
VSRELGVKYVLEGSVRKADNQVRITAQLVDATTGDQIWAENYDRPLHDIFSLQNEIVQRIATTLNLELTLEERGLLYKKRTDNLEAYDDFLQALEYGLSITKDGDEKARQALEKAIALDPRYSDAYAALGYNYLYDAVQQWNRDPHVFDQMFQAAQKAITFDDSNALAYMLLSAAYMISKRDYDQSLTAAQRAIAIDPNSPGGYTSLAYVLENSGRPAEGIQALEKAMRLDPRNRNSEFPGYLVLEGQGYALMGRYKEAIPVFKEYLARHPNFLAVHHWLAACYIEVGRMDDARAEAAEVMRINPGFSLQRQKQISVIKGPMRDRLYGDMAKAGLK